MTEKLTYDPTPADAPELSEDEQNSLEVAEQLQKEEASLLAGKFENAQELENAYIELQKKLGSQDSKDTEAEPAAESDTDTDAETETSTVNEGYKEDGTVDYTAVNTQYGDKLGALFEENNVVPWEISKHFHETKGEITDEIYKTLQDTELSRASINSYIERRYE